MLYSYLCHLSSSEFHIFANWVSNDDGVEQIQSECCFPFILDVITGNTAWNICWSSSTRANSSKITSPDQPRSDAGLAGTDIMRDLLLNVTDVELSVYDTKPFEAILHASAHYLTLRNSSSADLWFTDTSNTRLSLCIMLLWTALAANVSDLPHCRLILDMMNGFWSAKIDHWYGRSICLNGFVIMRYKPNNCYI